jgi:hypothetical protein
VLHVAFFNLHVTRLHLTADKTFVQKRRIKTLMQLTLMPLSRIFERQKTRKSIWSVLHHPGVNPIKEIFSLKKAKLVLTFLDSALPQL